MLAVPCLACFGILRTMVDRLTVRGLLAEELLLLIKPQQETKPGGAVAVLRLRGIKPGLATPQPAMPLPPPARKTPMSCRPGSPDAVGGVTASRI